MNFGKRFETIVESLETDLANLAKKSVADVKTAESHVSLSAKPFGVGSAAPVKVSASLKPAASVAVQPQAKDYDSSVADLTTVSANLKALAATQTTQAQSLSDQIVALTAQRDTAISTANEATNTAAAVDAILAPIAAIKQVADPAPVAGAAE